jgi:hypothetical protein
MFPCVAVLVDSLPWGSPRHCFRKSIHREKPLLLCFCSGAAGCVSSSLPPALLAGTILLFMSRSISFFSRHSPPINPPHPHSPPINPPHPRTCSPVSPQFLMYSGVPSSILLITFINSIAPGNLTSYQSSRHGDSRRSQMPWLPDDVWLFPGICATPSQEQTLSSCRNEPRGGYC